MHRKRKDVNEVLNSSNFEDDQKTANEITIAAAGSTPKYNGDNFAYDVEKIIRKINELREEANSNK